MYKMVNLVYIKVHLVIDVMRHSKCWHDPGEEN